MVIDFEVFDGIVDFDEAASAGGTLDHRILEHRDAQDQHPMSAITGLEEALENASGLPDVTEANNNQIMRVVGGEWALTAFYSVTSNDAGGNTLNL